MEELKQRILKYGSARAECGIVLVNSPNKNYSFKKAFYQFFVPSEEDDVVIPDWIGEEIIDVFGMVEPDHYLCAAEVGLRLIPH
jgi:hypothetical protein